MIKNSVLETMIEQGGKFESRLAELYFAADSKNSAKLETAFNEIFEKWEKLTIKAMKLCDDCEAVGIHK